MVADGGPAAANLGQLAGSVSARLGFRAPGSTASPDVAGAFLADAAVKPDADLQEAASHLGVDRQGASPTESGLRNAGDILNRQVRVSSVMHSAHRDPPVDWWTLVGVCVLL